MSRQCSLKADRPSAPMRGSAPAEGDAAREQSKKKPDFDWPRFAADLTDKVEAVGSYAAVCAAHPGINTGMLSRALNGRRMAVETVLHLCACLGLNPWEYYDLVEYVPKVRRVKPKTMADVLRNQGVTAPVSRETPAHEGCE